jgi:hydroxymethylbilane synthase
MTAPLRIGTRGSPLALWQANHVADRLRPLAAPRPVELVLIQTEGDRDVNTSLAHIGGQGVFTKEIQRALLDGWVDVAVHSLKDLPTFPVEGLALGAVPVRGPTADVLVSPAGVRFDDLPVGAKVATGSLRRRAQVKHRRPDVELVDIRGNVETRLKKLRDYGYDGLILARAGLDRLGLDVASEVLDPAWMLPAVGQGALGLECRAADTPTLTLLAPLNDPATHQAVTAERSLLYHLGGGCQVPIGAAAAVAGDRLTLRGAVLAPDGSRRIEGMLAGPAGDAETVGRRLAERLNADGAGELLRLAR